MKLCAVVVDTTPHGSNGSPSVSADSSGVARSSAKTVKTPWMFTLANRTSAQIG